MPAGSKAQVWHSLPLPQNISPRQLVQYCKQVSQRLPSQDLNNPIFLQYVFYNTQQVFSEMKSMLTPFQRISWYTRQLSLLFRKKIRPCHCSKVTRGAEYSPYNLEVVGCHQLYLFPQTNYWKDKEITYFPVLSPVPSLKGKASSSCNGPKY